MPVFDLPTLLAQRQLAIYKNGLKLIVPDTASTPAGKLAHGEAFADNFVESALNRVTDNHRLNQREWVTDTPTYGVNTKTYENGETCVKDDIIYQNQSGGTLTFTSVPGVAPITEWFPLTNGGSPTFNIPFWNNTGIIHVNGVPVNTGAVAYAHDVIVRAGNGLYQRDDITNPPPVSTNFINEFVMGQWIYLGEMTVMPRADFNTLFLNSGLTPTRWYFLNDVVHTNGTGVWLQGTAVNNYSRDGYIIADYSGAPPLRGTVEVEKVKYDSVANTFLERTDNYGNFARQTSTAVNGGGAANCVDRTPWGYTWLEGNIFDNVRFTNTWTPALISSMKNNNLKNLIHNNTAPGTTLAFNDNIADTGTFNTTASTVSFTKCEARNGGVVTATGNLVNAVSSSVGGGVASSDYARNHGNNSLASSVSSGGYSWSSGNNPITTGAGAFNHGITNTNRGDGGVTFGSSSLVDTGANYGAAIGEGCNVTALYGFGQGDHNNVSARNATAKGRYGAAGIVNQHVTGVTNAADVSTGIIFQLQPFYIPLVTRTTNAVATLLTTAMGVGATPISVPAGYVWWFEIELGANNDTGVATARFSVKGHLRNAAGVITYLGDIFYLDSSGVYTVAVAGVCLPMFADAGLAATTLTLTSAGSDMTPMATGVAATNINWLGLMTAGQLR